MPIVYLSPLRKVSYLAIPDDAYHDIFDLTVERAVSDNQIKLVIVNLVAETVIQWKE